MSPENSGSYANGVKVTAEPWRSELLTEVLPGFDPERDALRSSLLDARRSPIGASGGHTQRPSGSARAGRTAPPQGSQAAEPFHGGVWECCRWPPDLTPESVDHGQDGQLLQHTRHGVTVPHVHGHRGVTVRPGGFDLPALAVPLGEGGTTVDLRVEPRGPQGHLTGPTAGPTDAGAPLAEGPGVWQGRQGFPGAPRGPGLRLPPGDAWGMDAERLQPARARGACDRWRPPHTRRDQGPPGRAIHE